MRRRAAEEPELFVDAADPQPARRIPTRAEIAITLRFLMTRTVLVTVPKCRVEEHSKIATLAAALGDHEVGLVAD